MNNTPTNILLQPYMDICKGYGLTDSEGIERLADVGLKMALYQHIDRHERLDVGERQFRKELATLASIFKNGKGVKIQASMPDGDFKNKHITLEIETDGFLQYMTFLSLNSLLVHHSFEYGLLNITEKKEDLKLEKWKGNHLFGYDGIFKEPFTDKELAGIIHYEETMIANEKTMKGRTEKEIPRLGSMVHGLIRAGGDMLAFMTPTEKYCMIGDLMLAADILPIEESDWKNVLTNKEKADTIKSWEASFTKACDKFKGWLIS